MLIKSLPLAARMIAPHISVGLFWCWADHAWLAILGYHLQILIGNGKPEISRVIPNDKRVIVFTLPMLLVGPLLVLLMPHISYTDLEVWLTQHRLSGISWAAMVFYFGLVHPWLEQHHWTPLRKRTPLAHLFFAGYHLLVLESLLTGPWLLVAFLVLMSTSYLWFWLTKKTESFAIVVTSHIFADLSIAVAAWVAISF